MKTVVVFRKKLNQKPQLAIFDNVKVDDIISGSKRKPIIPNDWIIEEIGIGSKFEETYTKKWKITKKNINPDFSMSK